jgi:hypothetical protein
VRDILRAEEIDHLLGHISRKVSIDDLVNGVVPEEVKNHDNPTVNS